MNPLWLTVNIVTHEWTLFDWQLTLWRMNELSLTDNKHCDFQHFLNAF